MWIRSQDKKILTEIHDVEIDSVNQIWGSGSFIGEYSTEKKALKVLNEIQEVIEDNQFTINNTGIGDYVLYNSVQVYDMPQDDEV